MLGFANAIAGVHLATIVATVAVYFLILGLLNSRRHPQLLRARWDFTLLLAAVSPLFILPVLARIGVTLPAVLVAVGAVISAARLLAPRGPAWVIYNMPLAEATDAVGRVLEAMGLKVRRHPGRLELPELGAAVEIGGFPMLRNVSLRLRGGEKLADELETRLAAAMEATSAETSPMAVSLLLVATAMLVIPATLMAHHAVEIVRVLTDLLP